ncbi:patatin-like phospholipase family protein [Pedobacter sp. PLR]|uniref:patatin-like phospholipase family protein n=1 Tax=Pedobacter sp. PLR TaxID=2994465 RepID=UPI002247C3F7|nr:patatin-like phospholipase family protein [Pedobacter sp. PLR]MCX2452602.1 patatin-like phospholipase family protein [Pedobacter sp. PLR]
MVRALVISGGGSKGAFAGGLAEYLITVCKHDYKIFIGSSTGSLLVPLLSIAEIPKLKTVFTAVTQEQIFNIDPFIIKKRKNGLFRTSINHLGILKMFLKKRMTFGESKNLRELIKKTITPDDYKRILNADRDVIVTVSNLSKMTVEYKLAKDCSYEDYCDWIWASTSLVPFMSLVRKNGDDYADGGMGDLIPIYEAIQRGATDIDVIVLKSDRSLLQTPAIHNALDLTYRIFGFMLNQIGLDDLTIGKLESLNKKVKLHFYHPLEVLTSNSLIFDPEQMKLWWDLGFKCGEASALNPKVVEIN